MQSGTRHWLLLRLRILCIAIFLIGSVIPPYIPREALVQPLDEDLAEYTPQFLLVEDGFLLKSSSLTDQSSRRAFAQGLIHTVAAGESIAKISQRYGIKPETIVWANHLVAGKALAPGMQLLILPVDGVLHTVSRGQTLGRIAELYSISVDAIMQQNRLESGFIIAGQELIIPGGKPIIVKQVAVVPPAPPTAQPPKKPAVIPPLKPTAKTPTIAPPSAQTKGILQMPCENCFYTQYYHPGHYAVDIQERGGGPIYAAEDGIVIRADYGWNGGYGNVVEIDHGGGLITLYGHNKELYVAKGDRVGRGQKISWMGNTGRVYGATGIHTHFEVRVNGVKKNPLLYLE